MCRLFLLLFGLGLAAGNDELNVEVLYKPETCSQLSRDGDYLSYHYVGQLLDGTEFDCSFNYNQPYRFTLGRRMVIVGMERGLIGMCAGERRKITIPSDLAYGERGAGEKIPPNATLVFYVDLLTIERTEHVLSPSETFDDLFEAGLTAYGSQHWDESVMLFEASLEAKANETAFLYDCYAHSCSASDIQDELSSDYSFEEERFMGHLLALVRRTTCARRCRERLYGRHKKFNANVATGWKTRDVYNYLQFAYHKLNRIDEATAAAQAYFEFNRDGKMAGENVRYYYSLMPKGNLTYRPRERLMEHKQLYEEGGKIYGQKNWTQAVEKLELALEKFYAAFGECRLDCLNNFTDYFDLDLDNEIGDDLLGATARYVGAYILCQLNCYVELTRHEDTAGKKEKYYVGRHYNFLQFAYFKSGNVWKASQCAATYKLFDPEDETMASNIVYYEKQADADLTAREEAVQFLNELTKLRLLFREMTLPRAFVLSEAIPKRKGDAGGPDEEAKDEDVKHFKDGTPVINGVAGK